MFKPLLKLKHWQYFLILIGGIIIFEMLAIFPIMSAAAKNEKPDPSLFQSLFIMIPLLTIFSMYMTYGWQWGIISALRDKLPEGIKMPHRRIKIFFIIPVAYILIIMLGMVTFALDIINAPDPEHYFENDEPPVFFIMSILLMFPLHLFSMFCVFHNMYFAGKTMKAVELQKPNLKFDEFAAEFFLIWFNVIGIWILQPRLNKLIAGTYEFEPKEEVVDQVKPDDEEVI